MSMTSPAGNMLLGSEWMWPHAHLAVCMCLAHLPFHRLFTVSHDFTLHNK